ncbi:hypothetical protein GCM10023310_23940 [Paenibacillus vulneris]|uniref:Uncharacterized protein n=1 Tax=Paenibacillus vulneris TaxID=1133364 RepID=A0ABW3UYR6_9BACL
MSRTDVRSYRMLRWLAAAAFDIAVIFGVMTLLSEAFLLEPEKQAIAGMVLAAGLIAVNGILVRPQLFFRNSSFPYCVSMIMLTVAYLLISNLISILFISGSVLGYIGWELFLFALYAALYAILLFFARQDSDDRLRTKLERDVKHTIQAQLSTIEEALRDKEPNPAAASIWKAFKLLKERFQASTPFGRIAGSSQIMELEHRVQVNLDFLQLHMKSSLHEGNLNDILKLIEETHMLLNHREALNIQS